MFTPALDYTMMIGHHHALFYSHLLSTWDSVSLALYPHDVNKFVLIASNFYVAKVLSQRCSWLPMREGASERAEVKRIKHDGGDGGSRRNETGGGEAGQRPGM
jgi:hypothetical protein